MSPARGHLLVAVAAILFAANAPLSAVLIAGGIGPAYVTSSRLAGLGAVMLAWALASYRAELRSLRPRDVLELAVYGVVGLAVLIWAEATAFERIGVGVTLMIVYAAPFPVAAASWLLWRQRQPRVVLVAGAVALVGIALVLGIGGDDSAALEPAGLLYAVGACLAFSYYVLHASALLARLPAPVVLGVAAPVALVVWSVTRAPIWDYPVELLGAPMPLGGRLEGVAPPGALLVLASGLAGTALPFAFFFRGVAAIGPTRAAIVLMLQTVGSIALAWIWLGQSLDALQVAGAALVLGAVLALQRRG